MSQTYKFNLVSFKLCPFVMRAAIILEEKQLDYEIEYIDLENKPDWFLKISPLGKVPVLIVDDKTVLFESAVIAEFIDEVTPGDMHPADPVLKAHNRAWIEFASQLLFAQYRLQISETVDEYTIKLNEIDDKFVLLEDELKNTPFFNGTDFCLVDVAFAPVFMRFALLEEYTGYNYIGRYPKIAAWSKALCTKDSVKNSVVSDFTELFYEYLLKQDKYLATTFNSKAS